jgi:AraC-like DNA-binding protein
MFIQKWDDGILHLFNFLLDNMLYKKEETHHNEVAERSKKVKKGFIGQRMIVLPPNIKKIVMKNELIKRFNFTDMGYYPYAVFHDRERKSGSSEYILLYCTEGRGTIELHNFSVELGPNTFYIIPKNTPHHYKSSPKAPWSIYWVHFAGENADLLAARYLENRTDNVSLPYDEKRIRDFEGIFNLLENSFDEKELEIINIKLLDYIASFVYFKEIDPAYQEDDVISDSVAYMKKNIGSIFTLKQLAQQQRLSVAQYSRLFKLKMGSSPSLYFSQLKIQKSCQYLYFSDRNIKEICVELGFTDPYYFSRLFKKVMGKSPALYKNQHKKN